MASPTPSRSIRSSTWPFVWLCLVTRRVMVPLSSDWSRPRAESRSARSRRELGGGGLPGGGADEGAAALRIEEVEAGRVDRERYPIAHAGARAWVDPRREEGALVREDRGVGARGLRGAGRSCVDVEEHVSVGPQFLEHGHRCVERRQPGPCEG